MPNRMLSEQVYQEVVAQIDQGQLQAVLDIQLESTSGTDPARESLLQEGRAVCSNPQRFELLGEQGELLIRV